MFLALARGEYEGDWSAKGAVRVFTKLKTSLARFAFLSLAAMRAAAAKDRKKCF
jgi:hypothetical protein